MASLRKRPGSEKWVCCYTLPDGTRAQKSTGKTIRDKALAVCLEWEAAADRAREGNFTEAQARKVVSDISERAGLGPVEFSSAKKFLNDWIEGKEVTKAKATSVRYRHTIDTFLTFLEQRASNNIANIRPSDISAFRDKQVKDGKSHGTANMVVKTLRIALNTARRQGLILSNPADAVDLLPSERQNRTTFTREQITNLLNVANTEWQGMILLGVCHGLRLGDAVRLTWDNIDAERQSIKLKPQKTTGDGLSYDCRERSGKSIHIQHQELEHARLAVALPPVNSFSYPASCFASCQTGDPSHLQPLRN